MKYVVFAYECYPYPIVKHLLDEDQYVIVGVIKFIEQLKLEDNNDDDTPEQKRQRVSVYDGLVEKRTAEEVLSMLAKVPPNERDDYFCFFDFNNMHNIADRVVKMGFRNGLLPTKFYYDMEKERSKAKKFVKKHYTGIVQADAHPFKRVMEGVNFLKTADRAYVLKSNGNHAGTVVPKGDVEQAREQVIKALQTDAKQYENGGFMLEEKIDNCLEVTPVMVFYNGKPIYSVVEFECKPLGAGDIGVQKGGNLSLSVKTDLNCKLNRRSFPPVIHQLAKDHPGLAVFDIGLLFNGQNFYFTEFCGMRYGWDGIFSEMVMRDDGKPFVNKYFDDLVKGKSPIVNDYGASVRLFNINSHGEKTLDSADDVKVTWHVDQKNNLFFYNIKKDKDGIVTVGGRDILGVATGASNKLEDAVSKAYKAAETVECEKLYYRPQFDFLSRDYKSSILNRFDAVRKYLK